jgi:hypothetical protein
VAQKIQTLFIDDIDGSVAEGIVRFGLDGTQYEIDLNAEHTRRRSAFGKYRNMPANWAAARRAGALVHAQRTQLLFMQGPFLPAAGAPNRLSTSSVTIQ